MSGPVASSANSAGPRAPLPSDANPFATRFIRPGAAAFLFAANVTPENLVSQLRQQAWRGEIVGPHGSGKSSLLAALWPLLAAADREIAFSQLREGERQLPFTAAQRRAWNARTLIIIDGYEQLSAWGRWRLKGWVARQRCGLLVTSHTPAGLPNLCRPVISLELAQRVAACLQAGHPGLVHNADVARAFAKHGENLRETLFELYDVYEQRRRAPAAEPGLPT